MTFKRLLQYVRTGPGFCSGDFSKNCESLNLHSMRTVKAAGVQWGWFGFMFFRAVPIAPHETRNEQITREKLSYLKSVAWDQIWQFIVVVAAIGSVLTGGYWYVLDNFSRASYCELVAIFLILIGQIDWTMKHKIVVLVPGARVSDILQVVHTAASDGYQALDAECCERCGGPTELGYCSKPGCDLIPPSADCNQCGSMLQPNGLCPDHTCPHSSYLQDEGFTKG